MKIIYYGFFLTETSTKKLREKEPLLEKVVEDVHITFAFRPSDRLPDEMLGKTFTICVVGSGRTKDNHGYEIILPLELHKYYKGSKPKHITVSLSENGKPVHTKDVPFEKWDEEDRLLIQGKMGYFTNKGIVYSNSEFGKGR